MDILLTQATNLLAFGMRVLPYFSLWVAERLFTIAPAFCRKVDQRYTSDKILACVVGGDLPMFPQLNGGDAILFYPLPSCVRYEVLEYPDLEPTPMFGGKILAFIIPPEKRLQRYHVCGYDNQGRCYDAGRLFSHSDQRGTQVRREVSVVSGRIEWKIDTSRYLTGFVMVHSSGQPHAAGYSQNPFWRYPNTERLLHVVIPPDGTSLDQQGVSLMVMNVDTDAWVPEIQVWERGTAQIN